MTASLWIDRLLRASVEGAVLFAFVALVCRTVPALSARHRATLWWLAAAKLLLALAPIRPLELPLLPAPTAIERAWAAAGELPAATSLAPREITTPPRPSSRAIWVAGSWAAVSLFLFGLSLPGAVRARRLRRQGVPVTGPGLRAATADAARRLGLKRVPKVLLVAGVPGPLAVGLLRPAVLLPADLADRMSARELEMAIEHELAHIARRDLWLGLVPAAARRLFFFHPLAWWIEREYAIAREAACDEAVVTRHDADAFVYGRLLVRLAAGRPAATAAFSPRSMLRRRLEMIETTVRRRPRRARIAWALLAVAAASFVPLRLVARDSEAPPAPAADPTPAAAPAPPAPRAPDATPAPAPLAAIPRVLAPPPTGPEATAPPAPPSMRTPAPVPPASATPEATAPPALPRSSSPRARTPAPAPEAPSATEAPTLREPGEPAAIRWSGRCLALGDRDTDTAYVVTNGDARTMCGGPADMRAAERARVAGQDVVWFRVDDENWIIRDQATIEEARKLFDAQNGVGRMQAEVGAAQAQLGGQQAEIGERQSKLGAIQSEIAASLAGTDRNLDLQSKMQDLQLRMEELNQQMAGLNERQRELGQQQRLLGEQMAQKAEVARSQLSDLLQRAMRNGNAVRDR